MTPFYFDDRFGWLHEPSASAARPTRGIVLCNPYAQEEVCAHHGMMALGEMIAGAGMVALRFDYRGCGDSNDAATTVASMVGDAVAAAAVLRAALGPDGDIAFVGVRLGSAVAAMAAAMCRDAGDPVAGLGLLAPVISGGTFLRETRAAASVASLSGLDPVPAADADALFNTNGFHWSLALREEVAAIDLTTLAPPSFPALFVAPRADRRSAKLAATWPDATVTPFAAYDDWMQDPTTNRTPVEDFTPLVSWIGGLPVVRAAVADAAPAAAGSTAGHLDIGPVRETPVRFGPDDMLFGVLAAPRVGGSAPVAALLMHEGSTHHIGNGRAYVALARRLAAAGITSLRFDLSGMGDSPAGDNPRHPHYDPERIAEAQRAIDWLQQRGFASVVSFGLCSGAYAALDVARRDDRVTGFLVTNLQKMIWHYGDDIRVLVRDNRRSLKGYLRAMRNRGEWKRAFSGEVDIAAIVRVLAVRGVNQVRNTIAGMLPPPAGSERMQVREQMAALAQRRVHGTFLFSDEDPGLADMRVHFGRGGAGMADYPGCRMVLLPSADHHFNGSSARLRYFDLANETMARAIADAPVAAPAAAGDALAGAVPGKAAA